MLLVAGEDQSRNQPGWNSLAAAQRHQQPALAARIPAAAAQALQSAARIQVWFIGQPSHVVKQGLDPLLYGVFLGQHPPGSLHDFLVTALNAGRRAGGRALGWGGVRKTRVMQHGCRRPPNSQVAAKRIR